MLKSTNPKTTLDALSNIDCKHSDVDIITAENLEGGPDKCLEI